LRSFVLIRGATITIAAAQFIAQATIAAAQFPLKKLLAVCQTTIAAAPEKLVYRRSPRLII
jgi:hypothetical protein